MEITTKTLYWISTGLMIPVVILLILLFVRSLILIGTYYSDYVQKKRFDKKISPILEELSTENVREKITQDILTTKLPVSYYLRKILDKNKNDIYREKQLADFEIYCQKDLAKSQNLSKLGPVLGLMGTLIPMGPALVGLASGDIASMASNMQVAFSTTVVGLLTGAIGFIIMQEKKRNYANDTNNLEYIIDLLK